MARLILVTGGSRSGKSRYALALAETLGQPRLFIATCPVVDDEMRARIAKHQQARHRSSWHTIEETIDLVGAIRSAHTFDVILIDCLTLWINNLMYDAEQAGQPIEEEHVEQRCRDVLDACRDHTGTVVFVTNEVGTGVVPDNAAARLFRDLVGRANQVIAERADGVTLMTCGVPQHIKGA